MVAALLVEATALIIAAVLCAAFGGPTWATILLAVLGGLVLLAKVVD